MSPAPLNDTESTREKLFAEARRQFAARGFSGASIASIAGELGLTKQTLLHHFGSKEKLYAEVLADLAQALELRVAATSAAELAPLKRFEALMLESLRSEIGEQTQIVVRELLDNRERAPSAAHWHLQKYLETMTDLLRAVPGRESVSKAEAFAFLYQVLGAVSYFRISQPTLVGMFGPKQHRAIEISFAAQISELIRSWSTDTSHDR